MILVLNSQEAHVVLILLFINLRDGIVSILVLPFGIQFGFNILALVDSDDLVKAILLVDFFFIVKHA